MNNLISNQKKLETFNQSLNYITNSKIYKLLVEKEYKLINWVNSDLVFVNKKFDVSNSFIYIIFLSISSFKSIKSSLKIT